MTLFIWDIELFLLDIWLEPAFVAPVRVRNGETSCRSATSYLTDVAHKNSQLKEVLWNVMVMTAFQVNSEEIQSPSLSFESSRLQVRNNFLSDFLEDFESRIEIRENHQLV